MSNPWPQQPPSRPTGAPYGGGGQPPAAPPRGSTPLGSRPPAPVSIDSYAPPPSRVTPAIVLVIVALSLVLGFLGYRYVSGSPLGSPSPTPSARPSTEPTSTRTGGVPFEAKSDAAVGHWWVTSSRWTGNQLLVTVTVIVDQGQTKPQFYIFGNADSRVYDPDPSAPAPAFGEPTIRPGQTVSGNLVFRMPRGTATLVLTDSNGRQISALSIPG